MGEQDKVIVEQNQSVEFDTSYTVPILAIGAVIGALTGLGASYLMIQRANKRGEPPNLTAFEGIKLGLLVFGLLRSVAMLGSGDEK